MSHLPFRFALRALDETPDGQLYVEWETVDSQGYLLLQAEYLDVDMDDEDAVVGAIEQLKAQARINANRASHRGRKEQNEYLSDEKKVRIAHRVLEG